MGSPRGAQNYCFSTLSAFESQNFLAPALTRQGAMGSGFARASQRWRNQAAKLLSGRFYRPVALGLVLAGVIAISGAVLMLRYCYC